MAACESCGREFYNLRPGEVCAAICRGVVEIPPTPEGKAEEPQP